MCRCWCQTLFTSVYKTRICSKGGGIALKSMRRTQLSFPRAAPTRKTKHSLPAREELLPPSDPLSRLTAGGPPPNRPNTYLFEDHQSSRIHVYLISSCPSISIQLAKPQLHFFNHSIHDASTRCQAKMWNNDLLPSERHTHYI
jgi:hypothetical protein